MNKKLSFTALIVLALVVGIAIFISKQDDAVVQISSFEDCAAAGNPIQESYPRQCKTTDGRTFVEELDTSTMIRITAPTEGSRLQSPITLSGEARGPWYFEASFPVVLETTDGKVLTTVPVQAQGEWMTTEFVPFSGTISFSVPSETNAVLVFKRDNPSGLPEYDAAVRVPVVIY